MNPHTKASCFHPINFLAYGFGSGLLPITPGTWGTVAAIPLYCFLALLSPWWYWLVCVVGFAVGIPICKYTSDKLGVHDHPSIVWDEIVGFLVTMIAIPFSWQYIFLGFLLFRFFDILKPFPIRMIDQKVSGGFGIMVDDVLAAVYANIILQILYWFVLG